MTPGTKLRSLLNAICALHLFLCGLLFAGDERPNILFIFTDDQRWDAMSCAGSQHVRTPHIDSLASSGTRFSNAFVSLSICSPSRAAALTGRYNSANGVTTIGTGKLDPDEVTFAQMLKQAGYHTGVSGKWHLGNSPAECGFEFSTVCHGNGPWYGRGFTRQDGNEFSEDRFVDDVAVDEAIRFLKERNENKNTKPFVFWLCTQVPHMDHRHTWPTLGEFLKRSKPQDMPLASSWQDDLSTKPPYLPKSRSRVQALRYGYDRADAILKHSHEYHTAVEQMDASLGRLLQEMDRLKLRDNTWIFFMGDNGWMLGEHGFTSKVLPYEESIRVPMLACGPHTKPQVREELVLGIDITASILEIAGVPRPDNLHGRSLMPLIHSAKPTMDWRSTFLYEAPESQLGSEPLWAVRDTRWKYIETRTSKDEEEVFRELYDLQNDPTEMTNLAYEAAQKERIDAMSRQLRKLQAEVNH